MDKPGNTPVPQPRKSDDVAAFVEAARRTPAPTSSGRGRLIFALDATMSRQPTWDSAQRLQARMFQVAARSGGLEVQLVYYRGLSECKASAFVSEGRGLAELMSRIEVRGGETQIRRVLAHARNEARRAKVGALVFVGDAMEENPDALAALAGELALQGVRAFMFQEGATRRRGASSPRSPGSPAALTARSIRARRRGSRRSCARRPPMRRADTRRSRTKPSPTRRRGSCCRRCGDRETRVTLSRPASRVGSLAGARRGPDVKALLR